MYNTFNALTPSKRYAGYVVLLAILGFAIFRASSQAILHDEAVTYNLFASPGLLTLFARFDSNNHTLNTFFVWLSTSVFGLSVLTIRLPALLGGIIYLINSERICNLAFKKTTCYILALLSLTASPFLLDYYNTARGYSLALGFWMWALFLAWEGSNATPQPTPRRELLISILAALSVSANLAFAFINAGLIFAYTCLLLVNFYRKKIVIKQLALKLFWLAAPGGLLYLLITPSIFFFHTDTLYYGVGSWRRSLDTIVEVLLDQFAPSLAPTAWQPAIGAAAHFLLLAIVGLALTATATLLPNAVRRMRSGDAPEPAGHLWALLALSLFFTVGLLSAARLFWDVLLPRERTGIYLVPLLTLLVCLPLAALGKTGLQKWIGLAGQVCLTALIVYYGLCLRLDPPRMWTSYYRGDDTFAALLSEMEHYPKATIGVNWTLEPIFNFYAKLEHADDLPRFTRHTDYENYRLLVLLPKEDDRDKKYIDEHKLKTLYTNPVSGAVILLNPP